MVTIRVENEIRECPEEMTYQELAEEYQSRYEDDILLVRADGKLRELHKKLKPDSTIQFITCRDKPGMQTYVRSATLLLLKAFYDVVGSDNIEEVTVRFSVGSGLFIDPSGKFELNQELLDHVKMRMQDLVDRKLPIMKRSENTDDAIDLFHSYRMYDKERLFRYRRVSRVNIYSIGNFEDYFYGYMVQNTGYIKYFDLVLYQGGFALLYPDKSDTRHIPAFEPADKLFHVMMESCIWGERLGVDNVGALNETIAQGRIGKLILMSEALQEKKIAEIAEEITKKKEKKFVMIAGPSSSGKTSFANRLSIQLQTQGRRPHTISVDNYFLNRVDSPKDEFGNYNYEVLECLDLKQFNEDMTALLEGKTVELPQYNFKKGVREYKGDFLTMGPEDILVIEGIHCLNPGLSYALPKENKYNIYISALTQLNIDEHNRIPTTDGRLIRRMVRDSRTRGSSAQETIRMWPSVRRGEEQYIFPFQEQADAMFNSGMVYELAVLKQYAEPLLFGIPRESEEYLEAKRLLKFLDYFLGVGSEAIPVNSLVREFVGGSCFNV